VATVPLLALEQQAAASVEDAQELEHTHTTKLTTVTVTSFEGVHQLSRAHSAKRVGLGPDLVSA
jgi:hypothetical protein